MNRKQAREIMGGSCHVCPICDGRACAELLPGMGSAGTGRSFIDNFERLQSLKLRIKVLSTLQVPDMTTHFLGYDLSFPVLGAPVASVVMNMGGGQPESEYIGNVLDGCHEAGILGTTGDGPTEDICLTGAEAIGKADGFGIPFIKPWDDAVFQSRLDAALASGTKIIGIDVDAIGLTVLRRRGMATRMRTQEELAALIRSIPVPVILKGIMTPEEALMAVDVGAGAIVVSNHGGRLTDAAPATIDVLPGIAEAVAKRIPIIVDGGIRSGEDVMRVLASGADLAMIGRPIAIKAITEGRDGLVTYLQKLKADFERIMILTGCESLADIGPEILHK